ncbi:MAG: LysM peptidoglycan-binding domain-containing protein [Candidatus Kerfeldbacteria bacterium]|nr:LysM peptidoglycan-binding domain-containing protein [Candidatus Kerfeldbacteria bacterium]
MQRFFLITIIAAVLLSWPLNLRGLEYGGLGGRPAIPDPAIPNSQNWFIYALAPGTVKEDAVIVSNGGTEPVDAVVYPADATPSSDGGFALKQLEETMIGVGSWARLYPRERPTFADRLGTSILDWCGSPLDGSGPQSNRLTPAQKLELITWCRGVTSHELTLDGGQEISLPFVISTPPGLSAGEYTGGVVIQKKQPAASVTESGVQITTRVGVRIYQTVPGAVNKTLRISRFTIGPAAQPGYFTITLGVTNPSSVSLDHRSRIAIINRWTAQQQIIERPGQVLRDDELVINFPLKKPFFGRLRLQATVTYDVDGRSQSITSRVLHVTSIHWSLWAVVALLALGLGALLVRQRRGQSRRGSVPYSVKPYEDISALADRFGVAWQQLARLNRLNPPYRLTAGQVIGVPKRSNPKSGSRGHKKR